MLRAVFSPVRQEILRSGKTLTDDEGTFYTPSGFSWRKSVKEYFDTYYAICYRKQITPENLEAEYKKAVKIPYIHYDTITGLHEGIVTTVRQLRLKEVRPFDKLSCNPTVAEINECRKEYIEDNDFNQYFTLLLQIDSAMREYVQRIDELIGAYNVRFGCFRRALRNAKNENELKSSKKDATDKLLNLLGPYIKRLKTLGALPSSWTYDIKELPISDFHKSTLKEEEIERFEKYWSEDTLPLASFRERKEQEAAEYAELLRRARIRKEEEEKKRAEAKRRHREEEAKREKPTSPVKPTSPKLARSKPSRVKLFRPSLWYRFDKWVAGVGETIEYRIHDITDWLMHAAIWIAIIWAVLVVILTWINEGLFIAIIVVAIGTALIGILEGIAGILAAVVKYVSYIPLYAVRLIFYRGWTLLLTVLAGCGYLTYLILNANYII